MSKSATVWVVDDDRSIRWVLERALSQANISTHTFENGDDILRQLAATGHRPSLQTSVCRVLTGWICFKIFMSVTLSCRSL